MCLAAGCTAYLTKPIRQSALLQAIAAYAQAAAPERQAPELPARDSQMRAAQEPPGERARQRALMFLDNVRDNVTILQAAMSRTDFETVEQLGHGMRGAGGMFGFQPITDIGCALEIAGATTNLAAAAEAVSDLTRYLDRTQAIPTRGGVE